MKAVKSTGPYARAAAGYWSEGWSPIPLPPQRKYPPERGWTGGSKDNSGTLPSKEQIEKWIAAQGDGNVALRLPKNIIGIDVDLYDGKAGAATLAAAEEEWGPLQPTWMSSSRTDGSGIRLYRVPEGLQWPGELPQGKGVEIVKWDHRYAIVAPSIHPEGREYVWINTVGESTTDGEGWEFPGINTGEITELDQRWVDGLTGGKKWQPKSEADLTSEEVTDWLKNRDNPDGKMCEVMERTLAHHLQNIRPTGEKGGAHEGFTKAVWAILGDAAAGHKGIRKALERIQAAFREASKGRRSVAERNGEWRRSLEEGVRKVAAEGEPEDEDLCEATAVSHVARTRKRSGGSGDFDYARNDAGNARRFALRYRDAIVWVEGLGGWHIWDSETGLWRLDADGEATRMALSTVAAIRDEVKFLEDEKEKAKLLAFVSASGNDARIKAMLNMARSLKGMTAPAARFNANSRHVVVGNGTIELLGGGAGIKFRQSLPDDWDSIGMEVKYVAAAASDLWEKFLRRSIPDDEVREWVQRAAGYSLLGANPERLFFMVQGETSSGKSTFGEVIRDVLGQYGAPYELNLFRSQKEQGPNVQLVRLLPKRFILASEASAEVHLHADQIKRVTGSEALSGRLNRSNEMVERVPAFTPWLVTNSTPTIRGADMALYRRIYTIPFNETISVEDEDVFLGEKLRTGEGAEAVLSWIVEGWKRYAASGLRDAPAAVISATLGTREQLSEFDVWMTEQCVRGAEETAITEELYSNYSMWCDDASVKRESKIEFGRMLSKRGLRQVRVPVDSSKRLRGWMGVSIRV